MINTITMVQNYLEFIETWNTNLPTMNGFNTVMGDSAMNVIFTNYLFRKGYQEDALLEWDHSFVLEDGELNRTKYITELEEAFQQLLGDTDEVVCNK